MIRGDSETVTLMFTDSDKNLIPIANGDTLYFTVKKNIRDTEKILQKVLTDFPGGKAIIEIHSSDTSLLSPGKYVYDIQLTKSSGSVTTLIPPSDFILEGDVTRE